MKTLSLLRHAKSSWDDASLTDFERPLNERGLRTAPRVGQWLKEQAVKPDLIICSTAVRAKATCKLVSKTAEWNVSVEFNDSVYLASVEQLFDIVRAVDDTHNHLLLIGHNPGFEELLEYLTHERRHYPTAGFACIELSAERWRDIAASGNKLKLFLAPRSLDNVSSE